MNIPYSSPQLDLLEIAVEQGFNWSQNGDMTDDWNEMGPEEGL